VKHKLAMTLLVVAALVVSTLATFPVAGPVLAAPPDDPDTPPTPWPVDDPRYRPSINDNVILKWDEELLQAIRANPAATGPTVTARALGFLHTATYDAWETYDKVAKGTRPNGIPEQTLSKDPTVAQATKSKAISYAAYRVLVDLFPARTADFDAQMAELGYDPNEPSTDPATPQGVGTQAAQAVIAFRHADGSNQTLDTKGTPDPSDDTVTYPYLCTSNCYVPVNSGDTVTDWWRWQPLRVPLGTGNEQKPLAPHWGQVKPFALLSALQYKVPGPPKNPDGTYSTAEIQMALDDTADLTDTEKVRAEYWADGPHSEFPPGHWALFAQVLSRKRGHSLDTDAQMFFALGNALLDSSVAAWAQKYKYDFVRPITAIRYHPAFKDRTVRSWLGPYQGFGDVPGSQWLPYQSPNVVNPPFPEYVSGHSTFSGAAREVLLGFTGSDAFGATVTINAGTSLFEPRTDTQVGTPETDVTLSWPTLKAAADDAGLSRRNGGIHFYSGDLHGRSLGGMVGANAWSKARAYIKGYTGY
jgi:Domain of unknown function (DUF6851)/VCPO second helical-bundle domain